MNNGHQPQAIFFDLDGTILLNTHSPIDYFLLCCERLGHSFDGDASRQLARWQHEYWSQRNQVDADLALHGREKFWLAYNVRQLQFLGVAGSSNELLDYSLMIDTWFQAEYVYTPVVPGDVHPTLSHLRAAGLKVGLVSNRDHPLDAVAAENGLTGLFDFTLSAAEAASWKPEPGIFQRAVQLAGATPETAIYVGDNYFADILGARGAGLTPILIDRQGVFPDVDCRIIKEIGELKNL